MLRVIVKELPGAVRGKYRFEFSERAGESVVSYTLQGDELALRKFLADKLELRADAVSRLVAQLASANVAAAEVHDWALPEARALIRLVERESKLAAEQGKGVVQPAQASQ
jgi:Cdc6-like AAA superfamily ATPase